MAVAGLNRPAPTSAEDDPAPTSAEDEPASTPAEESSSSSCESSAEDCLPKVVSLVSTEENLLVTALSLSDTGETLADLPLAASKAAYPVVLTVCALSVTDLFNRLTAAD